MDSLAIENKIRAARTRLILDKPFLGALVLRLPIVAAKADWCKTVATDARQFYYNQAYIEQLNKDELQFVLAHEALHCGLSHFARRGHRIKHLWDVACDYAINPLLIDDGLKPPPGILYLSEYAGMTAEEIYPCIDERDEQETLDQHVYDDHHKDEQGGQRQNVGEGQSEQKGQAQTSDRPNESEQGDHEGGDRVEDGDDQNGEGQGANTEPQQTGQGGQQDGQTPADQPVETNENDQDSLADQPPPLTPQEMETLSIQWQQRLAGAAQQAMQADKMGGLMSRMIDFMIQPSLPWRMLLARYVSNVARDDYSYSRPSSRRGDPAIFPSLRSAQINLAVTIDVSGSLSDKEIGEFLSEIDALKSQMRCQVTILACDAQLVKDSPWCFQPWEAITLPKKITGGGGTSFCPPFNYLENLDIKPDVHLYFTDAKGEFPKHPPQFPVIWLVKGKEKVPWGVRVQLN